MKITGNSIRPGNVLSHKGGLWRAVKTMHTMPGKGGAFMQVELKNLIDGTKLNERFRSSETVEKVALEQREHQYLYGDGDSFTFMDLGSFDQITLHKDDVGDDAAFLQDGMKVIVEMFEGKAIGLSLPESVVLTIAETDAVVKGQTAASSYKPAVLDNGVRTSVPPFIKAGDKVLISTADGSYLKRAE
jgi:elongation factor P